MNTAVLVKVFVKDGLVQYRTGKRLGRLLHVHYYTMLLISKDTLL